MIQQRYPLSTGDINPFELQLAYKMFLVFLYGAFIFDLTVFSCLKKEILK